MSSNKGGIDFLKTTVIGGVVFLVPVVVFVAVLTKAAGLMMKVAEPVVRWLPLDSIGGVALANVIVVVGLVLVCFLGERTSRPRRLRASHGVPPWRRAMTAFVLELAVRAHSSLHCSV
jgi:hypothetical protein